MGASKEEFTEQREYEIQAGDFVTEEGMQGLLAFEVLEELEDNKVRIDATPLGGIYGGSTLDIKKENLIKIKD